MRGNIKNKIDLWVEKINDLEWVEFDCIKAWSTAGDITPPYPFQWQALTKLTKGDDEPYEGLGGTPLEAVKNLYVNLKGLEDSYDGE